MSEKVSELDSLIKEIKQSAKQISINKIDEVKVMKAMLNDKDFKISIYDKSEGLIGEKCPAEEARQFLSSVIQGSTGLDAKDSKHLAENYEFSKKDAVFMVNNAKDFMEVYMQTGRKINIIQNSTGEASIFAKSIPAATKRIPAKQGSPETKEIFIPSYTKIISISKVPKYTK